MVERYNASPQSEYLHQRKIEQAAELAEEVEDLLATFNEVRPHEALGQRIRSWCTGEIDTCFGPQLSRKVDTVHETPTLQEP